MLWSGRGRLRAALAEYQAAEERQAELEGSHALAGQLAGWRLSTHARLGQLTEARTALAGLDPELAGSGEIANARAALCLAEGEPAAALAAASEVLTGAVPALGQLTLTEANLLAATALRELGDERAAMTAVENALALAEPDHLVFPFAVTGSVELLEAMPRHETAHAALLHDVIDILRGIQAARREDLTLAEGEQLSLTELRVLRYLPTNLSRPEIARELSVSVNTVNTHLRNIYAKLHAQDRSSAVQRARGLRLLSVAPSSHSARRAGRHE